MKKFKYTILSFAAMLAMALSSCTGNVLDKESVNSFTQDNVFQDINLLEAYLYECYDQLGGDNGSILGMREDLLSSSTDETLNIHRAGSVVFLKNTISPSNLGMFNYPNWPSYYGWLTWPVLYRDIQSINTLLGGADDVPTSSSSEEAKLSQIKAEAYFLRAYEYTNLLRSYGGVVLMDKPFSLKDDFTNVTRSTLQETVDFILKDLEKAIAGLPDKSGIDQGRATKGAAGALKSRLLSFVTGELMNGTFNAGNDLVHFSSGSREERLRAAKTAAKDVIDGKYGTYSLAQYKEGEPSADMSDDDFQGYVDNYAGIFLQKGAWNDEAIFGVQYLDQVGNTAWNNLWWGPNGYSCWGNNGPTENLVRKYEMSDGTPFQWDKYKPGDNNIRAWTAEQLAADPDRNPYNGREARFYASILYDGATWANRETASNIIDIGSHYTATNGASYLDSDLKTIHDFGEGTAAKIGGVDSRNASKQAWNGTKTGYYLRKMLDPEIENAEAHSNTNSWMEIRYAEVLLDYAEACIELGEVAEGMKYVNMVRNRSGLPSRSTGCTQQEAREYYRHERQIEMMGEGDRWFMIRKWMIAEDNVFNVSPTYINHFADGVTIVYWDTTTMTDERSWNSNGCAYWLPIAKEEINRDPALQQNPNYD